MKTILEMPGKANSAVALKSKIIWRGQEEYPRMDMKNTRTPGGFDWERACWTKDESQKTEAEIIITGDWAPIRGFADIMEKTPEAIYGDLLPVLRGGDLRITNMECTLFGEKPVWKSGAVFKGGAEHIAALTSVPFDVVTLANNHVLDYGAEAFGQTKEFLRKNHVKFLGAGLTPEDACRPLIVNVKGIRIGLVNFSEGEDLSSPSEGPGVCGWEPERIAGMVKELRKNADIIIVICHCGLEYIAFPPPYVTDAFKRIADAGADLIVGHHPHVPQGVQIYNGVPICYSLGNFAFYQETDLLYRKLGYFVRAAITKKSVSRIEIIPYEINADRLDLLKDDKYDRFMKVLQKLSLPLDSDQGIKDAWHGTLRYYGLSGFQKEIDMILKTMANEPGKGAAMLRNRVITMQHKQQWTDAMTRIMDGTIGESPDWAYETAKEWLTKKRETT